MAHHIKRMGTDHEEILQPWFLVAQYNQMTEEIVFQAKHLEIEFAHAQNQNLQSRVDMLLRPFLRLRYKTTDEVLNLLSSALIQFDDQSFGFDSEHDLVALIKTSLFLWRRFPNFLQHFAPLPGMIDPAVQNLFDLRFVFLSWRLYNRAVAN